MTEQPHCGQPANANEGRRLIPDGIYVHASNRAKATLSGTEFHAHARPDDVKMLPFLDAINKGDERRALFQLQAILFWSPSWLGHPYAAWQITHLSGLGTDGDVPRELRDRANEELVELVKAWVAGLGYTAKIDRRPSRRGQAPFLFPRLDEREGILRTPEAEEERHAARGFLRIHDDLVARLKAIQWRDVRSQYRQCKPEGKEIVLDEVTELLRPILTAFVTRWWGASDGFSADELRAFARAGLLGPKGRNPSEATAYACLGSCEFLIAGTARKASPTLVRSTIRTLRKRRLL
jgi:hypothetical protein